MKPKKYVNKNTCLTRNNIMEIYDLYYNKKIIFKNVNYFLKNFIFLFLTQKDCENYVQYIF